MPRCLALVCCLALTASTSRGLEIGEVAPGIYRGPAPQCAADYSQLRALGVKTILDVRKFRRRAFDQERRDAAAHGMHYLLLPIAFRPERDGSAERAFKALTNARLYPIYVHCQLGRDRSSLLIGLYRVRCQGWTPGAAYAEMKRHGFKSFLRGLERYFWNRARCPSACGAST
jgi:protein tyrosine/serine phosphatase